ncbi:nitric oxide reductase F protein [Stappia taiwanensis]|uniref:Nitric oxide reductase F protein n=1 Tax=Stappia taiwanensis TaxID=992267 RepID=A0A838Y2X7_9HYPH|nr:nitric oxide reductase F protein [Stappia taiwanensis]MBA4613333.1 nitric oxide reductase F protein [Stappia taiwanensis]GGE81713.1 hypothetical protein GCM10007285_06650 [Stappia taiwanensis]
MLRNPLLRAWGLLIGLCLASTLVALAVERTSFAGLAATGAGATILLLAWLKARIILSEYLGLAAAPFWRRGFEIVLALYALLLLGLYTIPVL